MDTKNFDLIVIGSGPAGEKGAAQAAYFGKKVALVESQNVLGGAAANTGTLPSKTLRETALYLSGFRQRDLHGVTLTLGEHITARDFLFHQQRVTESERERIRQNLKLHGVEGYQGFASFVDPHTLSIARAGDDPLLVDGEHFLIATGSHPHRPANFPFEDPRVFDSDTILSIREIPSTMLVSGGGVIGCEYACMFSALGVKVTLVEGRHRLLGFLDAEVVETLTASMFRMGIDLIFDDGVDNVAAGDELEIKLKSGKSLSAGALLAASGRSGNTGGMNLAAVGIAPTSRGQIEVNSQYQTAVPHIYAVGDVIGFPALASTSMEQARVAMVHAFDLKYKTAVSTLLPYGIYTIPECSVVGETEDTLKQKGVAYVAGRARYGLNARGQIIGDHDGFLKLLFRVEDMKLLGVSVIGEQASELVHVGLTALLAGAGAELFIQMCFNYPTLSEMYKYAAYDALGERARKYAGYVGTDVT